MVNLIRRAGVVVVGAVVLACSAPGLGVAEPVAEPPAPSTSYHTLPADFSLAVTPTRVVVGPSEIDSAHRVQVINRGRDPLDVVVQKRNFVGGTDGSLVFRPGAPWAASSWVTVSPASFRLAPGTAQSVTAHIAKPADAEPGDHQVALVFLVPADPAGAENVKINRAIAAPMYITVPGPTDDSARLGGLAAPGFVTDGPVELTATVRNTGTVHHDFRGHARLAVDAAGSPASFPDFTVPRGGTRVVRTMWEPPLLCICHPSVSVTKADGSVETVRTQVIVFPWYLFVVLLLVVVLLVVLDIRRRRRRRSRVEARADA